MMSFQALQMKVSFHDGRRLSLRFDPLAVWKVKQFYRNVRAPAAKMQGGPEGIRKEVALWPSPMAFWGIPSNGIYKWTFTWDSPESQMVSFT